MKITKQLMADLEQLSKIDDEMYKMLNERFYDRTAGKLYGVLYTYVVEAIAPGFYDVVGDYKNSELGFISDAFADALFINYNIKKAKKCLKIYRKLKKEQKNANKV